LEFGNVDVICDSKKETVVLIGETKWQIAMSQRTGIRCIENVYTAVSGTFAFKEEI
jgi:hypothetical protein